MECGAEEYFCLAASWIAENEHLTAYIAERLGHLSAGSQGFFKLLGEIIGQHGQAIVALFGASFGFYKWWRFREHILHKRLEEYLKDSDTRLTEGERYILAALQRPGPGTPPKPPLFANPHLRNVLRERNWDKTTLAMNVESSADWQLTQAIGKIQRRIELAEASITSLKQQYATAHILKGAIAASVAERSPHKAADRNNLALSSFRTALQIKGHQADLIAKELEAHQLRKMGHLPEALAAYEELEELAQGVADERDQAIIVARAKRYRAEAMQALAATRDETGNLQFVRVLNAYRLVSNRIADSAINVRADFRPYTGWELIEEAEINFVAAFISSIMGYTDAEPDHLRDAEIAYRGVLTALPRRRFWEPSAQRRIKREAKKGLERVARAREGDYDTSWLVLPKSDAASSQQVNG